jgi:methylmalonyl-CoA mutase N-terminal domain/subunit
MGGRISPPQPSSRLTADTAEYAVKEIPTWNPANRYSYHMQKAGATDERVRLARSGATASGRSDAGGRRADLLVWFVSQ